jgi:hypothetical protein
MILLSSDEENNPPDDQMIPSSGSKADDIEITGEASQATSTIHAPTPSQDDSSC